jgi:hypothetical protein
MTRPDDVDTHCGIVAREIYAGRVVPFLGSGANLCGRPEELVWKPGQFDWLPDGTELARYLASMFHYQGKNDDDLARVSQYIAVVNGTYPLYAELRRLFNGNYPPTPLHRFLAKVPSILRRHQDPPPYQLIVTTNYDDLLERAFLDAGEPFDLVKYDAEGRFRGKFIHHPHNGEPRPIEQPNQYWEVSTDTRTVFLKIHGAVDRGDESQDSFVITEDHYIDYLARTDVSRLFPVRLLQKLRRNHCLFLGYSLRDWNLRVILNRLWGDEKLHLTSWAIQLNADPLDQELWNNRGVRILDSPLEEYIERLHAALLQAVYAGHGGRGA